ARLPALRPYRQAVHAGCDLGAVGGGGGAEEPLAEPARGGGAPAAWEEPVGCVERRAGSGRPQPPPRRRPWPRVRGPTPVAAAGGVGWGGGGRRPPLQRLVGSRGGQGFVSVRRAEP